MAPTSFRKALGAVKDQTSISLAKVSSNLAPDLEVLVVKATSHDDEPAEERHVRQIISLTSYSRAYVTACVDKLSRRLSKTRDWVVAVKTLALIHRLLSDGDPSFQLEILHSTRRGARLLSVSDFRDEAHSNSWDHSAFVRSLALYLDQRLDTALHDSRLRSSSASRPRDYDYQPPSPPRRSHRSRSFDDADKKPDAPAGDARPSTLVERMQQLNLLMDRFLAVRPTGRAKSSRLVLVALYPVVRESFKIYADLCELLAALLDRFFDMEYPDCVKAFEAYAAAAKQIDELVKFYGWCKETGVARSSEYPEVQRISDKLLDTLEDFIRDRSKRPKSPETAAPPPVAAEEPVEDMTSIRALPPPEGWEEPKPVETVPEPERKPQETGDLVDLREDGISADDQGNKLALALFSGPTGNSWNAFGDGTQEATSAWQNPAAEPGKADWELALVETASNLARQKPALPGGFDPVLLDGMYDQGIVRQHVSAQVTGGSASSVALPLPGLGRGGNQVLALPAPDGSVQTIGHDPFAASLTVPPPSYVQMADVEKKQQLLVQEQMLWQQYAREGMQGQASLAKLQSGYGYAAPQAMPYGMPMSYGMPPPINGGGQYYAQYPGL